MYWVPCIRLDVSVDADAQETRWLAAAAEPLLAAIQSNDVAHLNVALSAAALEALERHGCMALLDQLTRLAASRNVELLGTAAHDALLPLIPLDEACRQVELNEQALARVFGDLFRPSCLWPPALAISRRVFEVAERLDYETVLVDETAMRVEPGRWVGDRIDTVDGFPGIFLLPRSRPLSEEIARGEVRSREELRREHKEGTRYRPRYQVVAMSVTPRLAPPRALLQLFDRDPTLRIQDLLKHFDPSRATVPLPSSELSTWHELAGGQPFAAWYRHGDARQEARWKLACGISKVVRDLESRGLSALPEVRRLRQGLDEAWRESHWREGDDSDLLALQAASRGLSGILGDERSRELDRLFGALEAAHFGPGEGAERPML